MSFLFSIESIAERYAQIFEFYELNCREFKLDKIEIRYEDLIENLDMELTKLMAFLSLEKDSKYKDYQKHAKNKVISTASKNQVSKSLYQTSRYKWVNYRKQIQHIVPTLEKYIFKFNYEA
ncbi:sulfotransferase [Psychrosphaera sp. F3M07]|uniref:sulfotransferase n=1 Tax=Psychrosphaera sp. F3M07 TaxID=2841560 RepID=UPI001C087520|nr:sulfotransferase [Psychrosphaera sp. F3M07]MBU2917114.1 sulfotransferase [Psychrosphaera sp. F3M07]